MRPKEDIEKFVRLGKPRVTTNQQMDSRTLHDSFAAMQQTIQAKPGALRVIIKNRTIRFTTAAAILIAAITLFIVHQGTDEKDETVNVTGITKSPAELLTVASLNMAYRRGGIKAIEKQCDEAVDNLGPQPEDITIKELLTDFNGT